MEIVGKILFATGLRQDVFIQDEMSVEKLAADTSKCGDCPKKCSDYCPVDIDLPGELNGPIPQKCVTCMYCYLVCPNGAISFTGKAGFLDEQTRQYGDIVRKMV
jgi:MinD superfamily P-loop ATPase